MIGRRAVLVAALLALALPARAGGNAMLGLPADPSPAAVRAANRAAAEACKDADADLAGLEELAAEVVVLAEGVQWLAQGTPAAPPAPPAPARRVRGTPAPAAVPAPATRVRAARVAARAGRAAIDTTVAVRPGAKLELHNFGGTIRVATWARNAVRVQAEHSRRDWVEFEQERGVLRVQSASRLGPAQAVDFRLTLPPWMAISLSGIYNDVTAEGVEGGITVETVRGNIAVKRALGLIDLRSVEGLVDLADAKGNIKVSSVNDGVRLLRVTGDIQAEAVNGDIQLLQLNSNRVEATTLNGAVLYDGKLFDGGNYKFSSHNGDIAVAMAPGANATVSVSTYAGEFESAFPIKIGRTDLGKAFSFELGNGKAMVELESFQGAIQLFRPGDRQILQRIRESRAESDREQRRQARELKRQMKEDADDAEEDAADDEDAPAPAVHRKAGK